MDEFIVPVKQGVSIPTVLRQYEQVGGLALNWMLLGSSGIEKRPEKGVLASYNSCVINNHVKTIGEIVC